MKLEVEAPENSRPETKEFALGSGFSQSRIECEIIDGVKVEVRERSRLKLRGAAAAADLRAMALGFKLLNPFWNGRRKDSTKKRKFWATDLETGLRQRESG